MAATTILVQMEARPWTWEALSQACAEADATGARIVLVKLVPDSYLAWLCDDCDAYCFSEAETADIVDYQTLAADYGVPLSVRVFQYHNLEEGIVKAADELKANTVFATMPPSPVPFMHDAPLRHLEHRLHEHDHAFHSVAVAIP